MYIHVLCEASCNSKRVCSTCVLLLEGTEYLRYNLYKNQILKNEFDLFLFYL